MFKRLAARATWLSSSTVWKTSSKLRSTFDKEMWFSILLRLYHWIHVSESSMDCATLATGAEMTKHHANWPGTLSRRSAITTVAAASLTPRFCASVAASDDVAHLIERAAAKNAAFMRGDMDRWLALVRIASDFTLMQPFGGPTSHGFDASPERLAKLSQFSRTVRRPWRSCKPMHRTSWSFSSWSSGNMPKSGAYQNKTGRSELRKSIARTVLNGS